MTTTLLALLSSWILICAVFCLCCYYSQRRLEARIHSAVDFLTSCGYFVSTHRLWIDQRCVVAWKVKSYFQSTRLYPNCVYSSLENDREEVFSQCTKYQDEVLIGPPRNLKVRFCGMRLPDTPGRAGLECASCNGRLQAELGWCKPLQLFASCTR